MVKFNVFSVFCLLMASSMAAASYAGPFLFWGMENLSDMKAPALHALNDKSLRDIYSAASSIVIFIRNATTELNHENFPRLSEIAGGSKWLYLPQESLSSDPLEYNVNAEVFVLTGPVEQQDVEIAALYRDAQVNFGQKNILGILATRHEHLMYKRQVPTEAASTTETLMSSTTEAPDTPDTLVNNTVYEVAGKALLVVYEPPVLKVRGNKPSEDVTYELTNHLHASIDERVLEVFRLIVKFKASDKTIYIKFVFQIFGGHWAMNQVEYEGQVLDIVGSEVPAAPLDISYACGETFVYRKNGTSLTLKKLQVQPKLNGETKFGPAFDCVGVLTPGIASGIFVTAIIGIVLTIGITAILDIKTPNKFENRSSKQLTFTVQE